MKRLLLLLLGLSALVSAQQEINYLIFARELYVDAVKPLAEWKTRKGIPARIITEDSFPGGVWTPEGIRGRIAYGWNHQQTKYVLLVGLMEDDVYDVPTYEEGDIDGDYYYACMNGDHLEDIALGRLPSGVGSIEDVRHVVEKIVKYETDPLADGEDWIVRATTIRNEDNPPDHYYEADIAHVTELMQAAGYEQIDAFVGQKFVPPDQSAAVEEAFSEGRSLGVYRGQANMRWWFPFEVDEEDIHCGGRLPVIVSGTCVTATLYSNEVHDAMASRMLLSAGGAVGFYGTTEYGSSEYRSEVTKGFFDGLFVYRYHTLGDAALCGKRRLHQAMLNGNPYYDETALWEWSVQGDPEMHIWTARPRTLTASHPTTIYIEPQTLTVTVRDNRGIAVRNVTVCLMTRDMAIYMIGQTNIDGICTFGINPLEANELLVTANFPGYVPYRGQAQILDANRSDDANATYPTWARHLVRYPGSSSAHFVFQSAGQVFYRQTPGNPVECLGYGANPCISLDKWGRPWVVYKRDNCFYERVRRADGTWCSERWLFGDAMRIGYEYGDVAIVCSNWGSDVVPDPEPPDMAYGVCTATGIGNNRPNEVVFFAFDTLAAHPQLLQTLASSPQGQPGFWAPCIARTPGDRVHVGWITSDDMIYRTTAPPGIDPQQVRAGLEPVWEPPFGVSSTPWVTSSFLETSGDSLFAAWADESGGADVWRRARWIHSPYDQWSGHENQSGTPYYSVNGTMSSRKATTWCEWDYSAFRVMSRFVGETGNDPVYSSQNWLYDPHCNLRSVQTSPGVNYDFMRVLLTEDKGGGLYEVRTAEKLHIPQHTDALHYLVAVGQPEASPYCLFRNGYEASAGIPYDFAYAQLRYGLAFLDPMFRYSFRLMFYSEVPSALGFDVELDGVPIAHVSIAPMQMQSMDLTVPSELHRDGYIELTVTDPAGGMVVLAGLEIRQYEGAYEDADDGAQGRIVDPIPSGPALLVPSIAEREATVRYSLPRSIPVLLRVFDLTGREVRTLLTHRSGPQLRGWNTVSWNGLDKAGRQLSTGAYFLRLEADRTILTRKLTLLR